MRGVRAPSLASRGRATSLQPPASSLDSRAAAEVDSPAAHPSNRRVPDSAERPRSTPGSDPKAPRPSPGARIDRFSYFVLRRLNLAGLLLVGAGLCTADFIAVSHGRVFWTGLLTALQALLAIPWARTVVSMDQAEARILDSKRLGRFRRVALHAATFAALAVVLFHKALVVRQAAAAVPGDVSPFGATEQPYKTYVVYVFALIAGGLLGRGSRLARFLGSLADHPSRLMAISFGVIALLGGFVLSLPVSVRDWKDASFVDGLFTSMSAVCVTGLTVNDVASTYTGFGQFVLFVLIQAGGLGIMVLTASIAILAGRALRTRSTAALAEMIDAESFAALRRTIRHIFLFTVAIEAIGAVVLLAAFSNRPEIGLGPESDHPAAGAGSQVWSAVFHSVSAFCNAGFSLCHGNLTPFADSLAISGTIAVLIVLGGLGFPVLDEVVARTRDWYGGRPARRISLHTRVVLASTVALILLGTAGFLALEGHRMPADMPAGRFVLAAAFQSVTTRTAGFNTLDFGAMAHATLLFTCLLMWIGASPGSTGGGIKTTTFAVLLSAFRAEVRGSSSPRLFDRSVPDTTSRRAAAVAVGSCVLVAAVWFVLLVTEDGPPLPLLFETVSAFATCGLSTGTTVDGQATSLAGGFSVAGKFVLTLLMFVGRIGPMTAALAVVVKPRVEYFTVPEEKLLIG